MSLASDRLLGVIAIGTQASQALVERGAAHATIAAMVAVVATREASLVGVAWLCLLLVIVNVWVFAGRGQLQRFRRGYWRCVLGVAAVHLLVTACTSRSSDSLQAAPITCRHLHA